MHLGQIQSLHAPLFVCSVMRNRWCARRQSSPFTIRPLLFSLQRKEEDIPTYSFLPSFRLFSLFFPSFRSVDPSLSSSSPLHEKVCIALSSPVFSFLFPCLSAVTLSLASLARGESTPGESACVSPFPPSPSQANTEWVHTTWACTFPPHTQHFRGGLSPALTVL